MKHIRDKERGLAKGTRATVGSDPNTLFNIGALEAPILIVRDQNLETITDPEDNPEDVVDELVESKEATVCSLS